MISFKQKLIQTKSPYSKDFLKIIQRNFNILGEILLMILAKMKGQIR